MTPRVLVSLELFPKVASVIPGMDDLDIAYACARAGADGLVVGVPSETANRDSLARFDRPGLPLLCVRASLHQLDNLNALGSAPDRFFISDDGRAVKQFDSIADLKQRLSGTHQEIAALIEPEPQVIKSVAKTRANWVAFSTSELQQAESLAHAEQEMLRLRSAVLLASRNNLRVMLYGDVERHLAPSLARLEGLEEIVPTNTLWALALRHGWEQALETFRRWIE